MSEEADEEGGWSVATAEDNGKPLIFRIRTQLPPFAVKPAFETLLAVSWPYEPQGEHGMPTTAEVDRMSQLEDLLEAGLEGAGAAFLTVVVTGNGVREWQWYARSPDAAMAQVNETLGHLEPFPIEFSIQDDPDWAAYERFLNDIAEGDDDDDEA